jgi:alkanesulfonate monooxygenase SsuD/methylene tetrahydromethanopterin reductase-like flavin-dependent oxidoreductase (luciferase family)
MIVSLTWLAANTRRISFGSLVAPLSVRDPRMLARQAAALDDLSGGRFILGLGAGWQEREHTIFGYDLGDIPTRMARFAEGLELITRLLRDEEPVTFDGAYYSTHEARLLPRPERPGGPPLLIGGNGEKRTLPLAARYATIWNAVYLPVENFRETSGRLDELLRAADRKPEDVRRTVMLPLFFDPRDEDEVRRQIAAYSEAGADELIFQWMEMDDLEGLRAFARAALTQG